MLRSGSGFVLGIRRSGKGTGVGTEAWFCLGRACASLYVVADIAEPVMHENASAGYKQLNPSRFQQCDLEPTSHCHTEIAHRKLFDAPAGRFAKPGCGSLRKHNKCLASALGMFGMTRGG